MLHPTVMKPRVASTWCILSGQQFAVHVIDKIYPSIGTTGSCYIPNTHNKKWCSNQKNIRTANNFPADWWNGALSIDFSRQWERIQVTLLNSKLSHMHASEKKFINRRKFQKFHQEQKRKNHMKEGYNRLQVMTHIWPMLHQKTLKFTACSPTSCSSFSQHLWTK